VSLRARLTIVAVALVAAGLLVANLATYHYLSGFLLRRVDQQLEVAQPFAIRSLTDAGPTGAGPGPGDEVPIGITVELLGADGAVAKDVPTIYAGASPPVLPSGLPGSSASGSVGVTTFTAPSADGSISYRVRAVGPRPSAGTLVLAAPLTEVHNTLRRLMRVEFLVSLIVLGLVAALALWLVRVGLQPLEGMGETAGAIAGGDLTRRVEPADERTEVGRLGIALNTMLTHIESAFEQRRRSEERLRRFVADASHELRTPLTSIRGYAELFRRGADERPEDLAKSMTNIESEAARMGVLVDDMLLLARLDQGRPLERERLDLTAVVADAVESARAIEPDRTIDLTSDGSREIVGDASRLRQVVDNLLDNTRVHAPADAPVHVRVTTDGNEAVLSVADEGPGIDPEIAARIFERFTRGDPSRSRGTGGAGLGLSIVTAIVEAHGGQVRASARDGGGSVFEVRLPISGPADEPARRDADDASSNPTPEPAG
jgi:two-component system OmpR family sensor kinase